MDIFTGRQRIPALSIFAALLLLITATAADCEEPLGVLRHHVNRALDVLNDPLYEDESCRECQRKKLWQLLQSVFDFEEFSRLVLARNWRRLTPTQRIEFIDLFGRFLGGFYLGRLQTHYTDEKVEFLRQQMIGKKRAVVHINVIWRNQPIPVEVWMIKRRDRWKAYDVSALGISAVANYRAQFDAVLRSETVDQVLAHLREKLNHIR